MVAVLEIIMNMNRVRNVLPIKDTNILKEVEDTLLNNFRFGRRNYTIFQVGKATLLRVSDVLRLKITDVYDDNGNIKANAFIHDKKTGKPNTLYLKPVKDDLMTYYAYLNKNNLLSYPWLFPEMNHAERHLTEKQYYKVMHKVGELLGINYLGTHTMRKTGAYRVYEFPEMNHAERHLTEKQYYKVMHKVGELLGINYLGTHTMRKTGAYRVYEQTNHDIALVMHLLNHSSEAMTLKYLGLDREATEKKLDNVDFG